MIEITDFKQLNQLPHCPGVYLFYNKIDTLPVYIGKSIDLQKRVKSHYQQAKHDNKEQRIMSQTLFIDWRETVGEIEALLLEAKLIKEMMPIFNRRLRRHKSVFSICLTEKNNFLTPSIINSNIDEFTLNNNHYGLFRNKRNAEGTLDELIKEFKLCKKMLGLEKSSRTCFNYQLKRCSGACNGDVSASEHNQLLFEALEQYQQISWPYNGTIGITEKNDKEQVVHFIKDWAYLGSEKFNLNEETPKPKHDQKIKFDLDDYKILVKAIFKQELTTETVSR